MADLKPPSLAGRAALTLAMAAGFWLIGLGLAAALLWVPIAAARYGQIGFSSLVAGLGGVSLLWAMRPRGLFSRGDGPRPGALEREEFPRLYRFVEEVAQRVGARAPDRLHLIASVNAFASVDRRWWGLRRTRVVGLGLPLVAHLSREELATVLAHEFGHHRGGDVALGPWVHQLHQGLASTVDALEGSTFFLDLPFRAYGRVFLHISSAVSRAQELAADALAVEAYGANAAGRALAKVEALGPLWATYFELDVLPQLRRAVRVPLFDGFRRFLETPAKRPQVARALERQAQSTPLPGDSHPPLAERLAHLHLTSAPRPDLSQRGLDLLGGVEQAEAAWYRLAGMADLKAVGWDELGAEVVLPAIVEHISQGPLALDVPLAELAEHVARLETLAGKVRVGAINMLSLEARRRVACEHLVDWLSAALFRRGFAPRVVPGAALLLTRGEVTVDPEETVTQLVGGALSRERYLERCAAWER